VACCAASSLAACGLLFPTVLESGSDGGATGLDASDTGAATGDSTQAGAEGGDATGRADACGASCDATAGDATVPGDAGAADGATTGDTAADGANPGDAGDAAPPPCEAGPTDPHNCGVCGHDCLGGACFQGSCRQVAVSTGEPAPAYVAVDATHVYWTNDGPPSTGTGVVSAALDGGQRSGLVQPLGFANRVLSGGPFVYYNAEFQGTVAKVDPGTGVTTTFAPMPTSYSPTGLALSPDAGTLYWLGQLDEGGLSVHAQTLPSGSQTLLTHDTDGRLGQGLAADESALFFTAGVYSAGPDHQNLKRIDTAGCPDASSCGTILHAGTYINAVAVDGTYVYWAEQTVLGTGGQIARRGKDVDAGGYLVVAPSVNNVQFIVVDGPWLYFTEYAPANPDSGTAWGRVGRVGTDGTNLTYLADHQAYPLGLATDSTAIYWVNRGTLVQPANAFTASDGAILRMAK
jgi:hypothetical protein